MRGLQVEIYTPPKGVVEVAQKRCDHLIFGWKRQQGGHALDMMSLAVYCYLQGVQDAAQAVAIKGAKP